jgi:hypothetical protein
MEDRAGSEIADLFATRLEFLRPASVMFEALHEIDEVDPIGRFSNSPGFVEVNG